MYGSSVSSRTRSGVLTLAGVVALWMTATLGCARTSDTPAPSSGVGGAQPAAEADPLPSWNDTAPKKALVSFVERVTRHGMKDDWKTIFPK